VEKNPINAKYSEDRIYAYLKFHDGVVKRTEMPYLRKVVALEYCKDNLKMTYETAEDFMDFILENNWVEWDQHGAFPGTIMTADGAKYLQELTEKYQNQTLYKTDMSASTPKMITITWGPTKNLLELDTSELDIDEHDLYLFLKFAIGVSSGVGSPYLREIVAEEFLMDNLNLCYEKTDLFIARLLDADILEMDQYGAFPGLLVSNKGKELFEELKKKYL
jgi:predicted transcriptional regulator